MSALLYTLPQLLSDETHFSNVQSELLHSILARPAAAPQRQEINSSAPLEEVVDCD